MSKFDVEKLDDKYVNEIRKFIESKKDDIIEICVNELIRDDIFLLLDKYCTVIYYPINDTKNNGFHVTYYNDEEPVNFVYINTSQHREKQTFTAAHELGHIWEVDKLFGDKDHDSQERIINRFASELLMPKDIFIKHVTDELKQHLENGNNIDIMDMIKVITSAMNYFFTSYKSVVYRMYEVGLLGKESCDVLWISDNHPNSSAIVEISKKFAQENGYSRLYKDDKIKHIDGFTELLNTAKEKELLSKKKLASLYEKFDLKYGLPDNDLEQTVPINLEEGNGDNG